MLVCFVMLFLSLQTRNFGSLSNECYSTSVTVCFKSWRFLSNFNYIIFIMDGNYFLLFYAEPTL
ncbi:hypothetical protein Patl1_12874 [Pistacia atlantica]|uniref:Uncharacterized protein n=1 Tax=Pistacia atlantica TaxID=434234 RepID=A0ACC1ATN4_9ROSI|nr:hypothetical protein Patl1_12874 [Pistacia atlantica]